MRTCFSKSSRSILTTLWLTSASASWRWSGNASHRRVEHLETAIAGDPSHTAATLALGAAREGLGDLKGARNTYERGVTIAAKKGDASSARKMQERINALAERSR